jgi:hypothetical protein
MDATELEERPEGEAATPGPAFRKSDQMLNTQDGRCRPAARDAYNATIRHFRETGALAEKEMQAFAHIINPPGANVAAWLATCEAAENIERWIAAHPDEAAKLKNAGAGVGAAPAPDKPERAPVLEFAEDPVADLTGNPALLNGLPPEEAADEFGLRMLSLMQFQWAPKEMRVFARNEYNRVIREFIETGDAPGLVRKDFGWLADHPGADEFALKAHRMAQQAIRDWKALHLPKPAAPEVEDETSEAALPIKEHNHIPAVIRGQAFDLEVTRDRTWPDPKPVEQLSVSEEARRIFRQPMPEDETEALLNALIGEMHFNMREIAFGSMRQATDLSDRMEWVNASIRMAECGAKVAESVARLRGFEEPPPRRARSQAK